MVLIIDRNSERGARVWSYLGYLIWQLVRPTAVKSMFFLESPIFLQTCATRPELPSNIRSMIQTAFTQAKPQKAGFSRL